jgi:NADH-quinone oxidoreductase subunit A
VNLSSLLGPSRPSKEKLSTYESGVEPVGTAHERFSVKFYMVAVLFILFDIEVVFLYPWAVSFLNLESAKMVYSFASAMVFIIILLVGYIYIIKKGALKWD